MTYFTLYNSAKKISSKPSAHLFKKIQEKQSAYTSYYFEQSQEHEFKNFVHLIKANVLNAKQQKEMLSQFYQDWNSGQDSKIKVLQFKASLETLVKQFHSTFSSEQVQKKFYPYYLSNYKMNSSFSIYDGLPNSSFPDLCSKINRDPNADFSSCNNAYLTYEHTKNIQQFAFSFWTHCHPQPHIDSKRIVKNEEEYSIQCITPNLLTDFKDCMNNQKIGRLIGSYGIPSAEMTQNTSFSFTIPEANKLRIPNAVVFIVSNFHSTKLPDLQANLTQLLDYCNDKIEDGIKKEAAINLILLACLVFLLVFCCPCFCCKDDIMQLCSNMGTKLGTLLQSAKRQLKMVFRRRQPEPIFIPLTPPAHANPNDRALASQNIQEIELGTMP